jgi:hypothetical protein
MGDALLGHAEPASHLVLVGRQEPSHPSFRAALRKAKNTMSSQDLVPYRSGSLARPAERPQGIFQRLFNWITGWFFPRRQEQIEAERQAAERIKQAEHEAALANARRQYEKARFELEAKLRLSEIAAEANAAEAERRLRETVYSLPLSDANRLLDQAIELEEKLNRLTQLRQMRQSGQAASVSPVISLPAAAGQPLLQPQLADSHIETIALKVIARLGAGNDPSGERQWTDWRQQIYSEYPSGVAQEIVNRAEGHRQLIR